MVQVILSAFVSQISYDGESYDIFVYFIQIKQSTHCGEFQTVSLRLFTHAKYMILYAHWMVHICAMH